MFISSLPFACFGNPFSDWFRHPETDTARRDGRQPHQSRKEFIDEMLTRSPDAFSSAYDIEAAMLMFPDRF